MTKFRNIYLLALVFFIATTTTLVAADSPLPSNFYELLDDNTDLSKKEIVELSEAFYLGLKKYYNEQELDALFKHVYDLVEDDKNYVVSGKSCITKVNSNKHNPCWLHKHDRTAKRRVWQHQLTKEKRDFTDYRDKLN